MTFKADDRVFETSITTGTGTYTLDGAQVGFTTFAGMGNGNYCPYFATDDTNWEVGIGQVLTGPNRLARTTILRSSNADSAVDWGAGTRKIRCGLPAGMTIPRVLSKSVAGNSDVTLTSDEQRRAILILTGALTGNINLIVDDTPWVWTVYNNTSGAYTVNVKVSGQTGVKVAQGSRAILGCDGTDVFGAFNSTPITNSLGGDVALTNTGSFFDGPSIAQGTAGIWQVSGSVTCYNSAAATSFYAKLWDGTTLIDSARVSASLGEVKRISLSGRSISPAGNLRISVQDDGYTVNTNIKYNVSGLGKDSTITAERIG